MKYKIIALFILISFSGFSQIKPVRIKVLTFNILHGATTNNSFDLQLVSDIINDLDPDFVAMQEVDFKTNRAKKLDLMTEYAIRTNRIPLFGKAMHYDGGEYGEGILTKHTLINSRAIPLPYSNGNEPRTALEITVSLPTQDTISIVGTHLDHLKNEIDRISQANELNNVFLNNKYPTLLAGDLNAEPNSKTIGILKQEWGFSDSTDNPDFTYPSNNPLIKIDYILYYPKQKWKVINKQTICHKIASDHCAYFAELELLK